MLDETHATATVEEYLEAILNMVSEGEKVLAARLAERLQVSPPTVTVTLQRMGHLFSTRVVKWKGNKGILRT